jgi:hypothetical protein
MSFLLAFLHIFRTESKRGFDSLHPLQSAAVYSGAHESSMALAFAKLLPVIPGEVLRFGLDKKPAARLTGERKMTGDLGPEGPPNEDLVFSMTHDKTRLNTPRKKSR